MYTNKELGELGEKLAKKFLEERDYEIICQNFRGRQGEIDIIAKEKDEYVFIEVKTRSNKKYGLPREAVDQNKQKHIWNVAEYYVYIHRLENKYIRFDVIEVYAPEGHETQNPVINHMEGAFE